MIAGAPRKGRRHLLQITDKKARCIDEGSTGGSVSPLEGRVTRALHFSLRPGARLRGRAAPAPPTRCPSSTLCRAACKEAANPTSAQAPRSSPSAPPTLPLDSGEADTRRVRSPPPTRAEPPRGPGLPVRTAGGRRGDKGQSRSGSRPGAAPSAGWRPPHRGNLAPAARGRQSAAAPRGTPRC